MNRKVLQKVIDALNKENPDLSYIKGILETVIESLPQEGELVGATYSTGTTAVPVKPMIPEEVRAMAFIKDAEKMITHE